MQEKAMQLLEQMAEQLGVATEVIWATLLRQAPLQAVGSVAIILILMSSAAFVYWLGRKWLTSFMERDGVDEIEMLGIVMLFVISLVLLGFGIECIAADTPTILAGFFNPEYFALQEIFSIVK